MKALKKVYLSIIIPCYNAEKTISRCLESILGQKLNNIEIIAINDCSTDKSFKILKKFKDKIKIINNKKNLGVGLSRNKGIKKSNGDYLIFLDSDDMLVKNTLTKIICDLKKNNKTDFLIGQHNINKDGFIYKKNINKKSLNEKIKFINNLKKFYGYCWRFIISRSFLTKNNLKFSSARIFEDEEFVAKLFIKTKIFHFSKTHFYNHTLRQNSLSGSTNFKDIKSITTSMNNLNIYAHDIHLMKERKIFLFSRINIIFSHFTALLHSIDENNLKKISLIFHKVMTKKKIFFSKNYKEVINKNWLKNYILKSEKKIINIFQNYKLEKFIIFCIDRNGLALANIFKKNNFYIEGFLDNSKTTLHKNLIYKRLKLNKIYKDRKIIIANQRNQHVSDIKNQLISLKVKKKNIYNVKFGFFS